MKIRLMKLDDYEEIHKLWMSCVGMGLNNLDDSKGGIKRRNLLMPPFESSRLFNPIPTQDIQSLWISS